MRDLSTARHAPLIGRSPLLRVLPAAARIVLRAAEPARAAAERAFGAPVPKAACRAGVTAERAALWLGPDEWLLLAPADGAQSLLSGLESALSGHACSLVDVSHRQIGLEVAGAHAPLLLAAGCPLDLHPGAFPVGMCTRTLLGKTEIVLWRTAPEAFRVEVWRSFAAYLSAFLAEAARGML
jgi:sarcosine oxidase, subunit gamma